MPGEESLTLLRRWLRSDSKSIGGDFLLFSKELFIFFKGKLLCFFGIVQFTLLFLC